MSDGKPHLYAALICERVLREADGVNTLVRIVDNMRIHVASAGDASAPVLAQLSLFVGIRGGRFRGELPFRVLLLDERGAVVESKPAPPRPPLTVPFTDQQPDVNVVTPLTSPFPGAGRYVFKILLGDEDIGEAPFTLTPVLQQAP